MPTVTAMAMATVYADSTSTAVATPVPTSARDLEDLVVMEASARRVAAVFKLPVG
jgi:hypothetical protein